MSNYFEFSKKFKFLSLTKNFIDLRERIRKYYNHLYDRQGGLDDQRILEDLPGRLRTEVSLYMNGDIIHKVPFFKDCNQGFINSLVTQLKSEVYSPGEYIVQVCFYYFLLFFFMSLIYFFKEGDGNYFLEFS